MIRGLYEHMDSHLKELEEKFKKDECELREKIDKEIKQQMSDKLKTLKYTNSDIYKEDFMYNFGKINMCRDIYNNPSINQSQSITINIKDNSNRRREPNNILSYYGFFNNIQLINNDSALKNGEYVIGIYGDLNITIDHQYSDYIRSINIIVITNYLNKYKIINQYPINTEKHKKFNERYQLKVIKKNSMKLFDSQVDNINNIFNKINIYIVKQNQHQHNDTYKIITHYYPEMGKLIDLPKKQEIYKKTLEKYNFNSLPNECLNSNSKQNKYECCKKCYKEEEQKKNTELINLSNTIIYTLKNYAHTNGIESLQINHPYQGLVDNITYNLIDEDYNNNQIFNIFEKNFNDFWADKIHEINGDSKHDISMAQLIEHKDKTNNTLKIENKSMKQKIKKLEQEVKQNTNCKEYETQLKEQIKQLKSSISLLEIDLKTMRSNKTELETKYNQLKSKIEILLK